MKRMIYNFGMIFALVFSLLTTGCPANSIAKLKANSAKIATYTGVGINVTRDIYTQGLLPLAAKDKIADAFIVLSKSGIAFDEAVAAIEAAYGTNAPPASEITKLFAVFNAQVVGAFLDVLTQIGLNATISAKFKLVIDTIRTAVLIIAGVFGQRPAVASRLATAGGH